jgi:hypothetical protein
MRRAHRPAVCLLAVVCRSCSLWGLVLIDTMLFVLMYCIAGGMVGTSLALSRSEVPSMVCLMIYKYVMC